MLQAGYFFEYWTPSCVNLLTFLAACLWLHLYMKSTCTKSHVRHLYCQVCLEYKCNSQTGNLKSPVNLTCRSLDCGRKPEYPEKAPHRRAPVARVRTQNPLAVRQQCQPLHHRATLLQTLCIDFCYYSILLYYSISRFTCLKLLLVM